MKLEMGDLLFIYRGQEMIDQAIAHLFTGYDDLFFNHVGLYIGSGRVIEAVPPVVREVTFDVFVEEVYNRENMVIAKTDPKFTEMVIKYAKECVGLPYNETYIQRVDAFYCSSLIHYIFRRANSGKPYFKKQTLTFKDPETGDFMPFWKRFYEERGMDIPEGVEGSHPANLSLDPKLTDYRRLTLHNIKD